MRCVFKFIGIVVLFFSARACPVSASAVSINTAAQKLVDAEMSAYNLGRDITASVTIKCGNSKSLNSVGTRLVDSFEDIGKESFGAVGGENVEYYSSCGGCIRLDLSKASSSSSQGYWTQKRTYSRGKGSVKYSVTFKGRNPNFRQRIGETIAQNALVSELRRFVALIDNDWDLAWAVAYWLNLHMTFGNRDGHEYSIPWSEMYDCCRTGVRAEGYCRAFADAYTVFASSVGLSNVFTMPASGKHHEFNHLTIYGVDCYVDVVIFDITNVCEYPDGLGFLPWRYAKIETDSSVYDEYYSILESYRSRLKDPVKALELNHRLEEPDRDKYDIVKNGYPYEEIQGVAGKRHQYDWQYNLSFYVTSQAVS